MKAKHLTATILVATLFLFSVGVTAASNQGKSHDVWKPVPFVVSSDSSLLKSFLDVRHDFGNVFTANLNPSQVAFLNSFGIATEPVSIYYPTKPPGGCDPWPECKNGGGGDGDTGRLGTPSDQTPWGIEKVYNNPSITSTSGGVGVNVAVLDTGADKNHPDLSNVITQCKDFTKGRFVKNVCKDNVGHGTHVIGTIAANSGADGLGIFGVASGSNIFAYKVCGDAGCFTDDIAAAIDYAGSNGAHIVSMSLGGDSQSTLIKNAIARNPSLLFVAAAGNDGPADGSIDYPGANANVIAVGAIDVNENVASFSSRGINDGDFIVENREVEFGAPGVDVESTCAGSFDGASFDKDGTVNGYCIISGTSMATPHISGLAAKFWQGNAADTRNYLHSLAKDIWTAGDDTATGFGLPQVPA